MARDTLEPHRSGRTASDSAPVYSGISHIDDGAHRRTIGRHCLDEELTTMSCRPRRRRCVDANLIDVAGSAETG
jgi:hypothetical protein